MTLTAIRAEDVAGRPHAAPAAEQVRRRILDLLEDNVLCSIATVTPDGRAHINTAYFSYTDAFEVYFLSHPGSEHCRNLSTNRSMAMTVFSSAQQWTDPGQGIQLFGTCEQAKGSAFDAAERSYGGRFPGYASWRRAFGPDAPGREYTFYRFRAAAVKILDEKNFGDAVLVRAAVRATDREREGNG